MALFSTASTSSSGPSEMHPTRQKLYDEAECIRAECAKWLKQFIRPGQPKLMTKNEMFELARAELGVSRTAFDQAWIRAIEEAGRQDWYEPMRSHRVTKQ